ncbi:hypothetical protein LOY35_13205 [Pseudomonas sp. B21-028]|uniref:glycosyl hydrolase family 8 n=1 Tax=Pseudomonas sp. B21-028 TaxID=2895480 RepID=UPI0021605D79|nr:glycosyl hydrolase family 8 [Pseudomonas sp. B21-028]UVL86470.1 hypothetical protein LOY35_13205 [Pseudomonas sp. B21-028]
MKGFVALLLTLGIVNPASAAQCGWPAWESYKQALVSPDGRVIDASTEQRISTSEGQGYGLLFALLANDRTTAQRERLHQEPPAPDAYYNRSLLLFGQGWDERRYRFDKNGQLLPVWAPACKK